LRLAAETQPKDGVQGPAGPLLRLVQSRLQAHITDGYVNVSGRLVRNWAIAVDVIVMRERSRTFSWAPVCPADFFPPKTRVTPLWRSSFR
jgi:hypothetical protein